MTPVDTYNAQCDFSEIVKGAHKNKNLATTNECLLLFGNGDGGGGPTAPMLEKVGERETALMSASTDEQGGCAIDRRPTRQDCWSQRLFRAHAGDY